MSPKREFEKLGKRWSLPPDDDSTNWEPLPSDYPGWRPLEERLRPFERLAEIRNNALTAVIDGPLDKKQLKAAKAIWNNGSGASRDFRPFDVMSSQKCNRDHLRQPCIFSDFATCNRTRFSILTRKSEVLSEDAPEPHDTVSMSCLAAIVSDRWRKQKDRCAKKPEWSPWLRLIQHHGRTNSTRRLSARPRSESL